MHQVHRYHDICAGHRVAGHEGKCQHLHGHNYRIHFTCEATKLDAIGRVIDFSVVKEKLCMWLEDKWDHKFLAWENDQLMRSIDRAAGFHVARNSNTMLLEEVAMFGKWKESIVWVPFNPTAENLAEYLVTVIGPQQLAGTGVKLTHVRIEETAKCHASFGV